MEIKLLRKGPYELRIEIEGEGHTFCNMLQKTILEDEMVEMAGYDMPHPLVTKSIFYVRTKGKRRPETAMRDAAKKLRKKRRELMNALDRAFREFGKLASNS